MFSYEELIWTRAHLDIYFKRIIYIVLRKGKKLVYSTITFNSFCIHCFEDDRCSVETSCDLKLYASLSV